MAGRAARGGRLLPVGSVVLGGGHESRGVQIPVNLTTVAELRFVTSNGRPAMVARLNARSPWGHG